ncbi:hypothetical protein C8Q76DRAFT_673137 [Earliella scabrosa]|nr:hypothetical protein C8Q76DRAFT_673137 [Earliella scabrosa]
MRSSVSQTPEPQTISRCDDEWEFSTPEEMKQELEQDFTSQEKYDVWSDATTAVRSYYDELVVRWREEMDTLLVYAGLFSAVLTAFVVESYPLLQPDSSDPTVAMLQQISTQLNSFRIDPPFVNSTQTVQHILEDQTFNAPLSAVWINTLWFASLACSLAAASIALMVKQWLHHARSGLSGTSRDVARYRQHRLNSLQKWHVGTIVIALPVLLQVAVSLFLGGIVILLWTLHKTVAAVTSALIAILLAFFVVVTVMPLFRWDCCYRSPQAFILYTAIRFGYNTTKRMIVRILKLLWNLETRMAHGRLLMWLNFTDEIPTWQGRDQVAITQEAGTLDRCLATTAYATTLSYTYLDRLHILLFDLPWSQLRPALKDLWSTHERHWGGVNSPGERHWVEKVKRSELAVLYAIRQMLSVPINNRDWRWRDDVRAILNFFVSQVDPPRCGTELYISTLSSLALGTGDSEITWAASERVAAYWIHADAANGEAVSYSVIRNGAYNWTSH